MQKRKKQLPIKHDKKSIIDSILRVNHAGEYGAKRIYEGQLAFTRDKHAKAQIKKMHDQELAHLNYFEQQIIENKSRPTALMPIWHVGGYVLGAFTALLGHKTSMLCTQAVEEVIADHYQEQIDDLEDYHFTDKDVLKQKITQFRKEELEHKVIAEFNNAAEAPFNKLLTFGIQTICKTAIALSKRI